MTLVKISMLQRLSEKLNDDIQCRIARRAWEDTHIGISSPKVLCKYIMEKGDYANAGGGAFDQILHKRD